mmetsp:Transcript_23502/g.46309  ORF Transcript_23502/g.46309 Transcript_23502/m.46309 type:complete len:220 (-) Transcript_23502:35-694(-)
MSQVLTGNEVEFLAEDELVDIVPNFAHADGYPLIGGRIPPFRAGVPVKVPLWMAIKLKVAHKCKFLLPEWMTVENLRERLQEEQEEEKTFKYMPFHFIHVSQLLLQYGDRDIGSQASTIRELLRSISDLRACKIRNGLSMIRGDVNILKLNNICLGELNEIRKVTTQALDNFHALSEDALSRQGDGSQPLGSASQTQAEEEPSPTGSPAQQERSIRRFR